MIEKGKEQKFFTIHDLPVSERPRERLQKFGAGALSAQEILALILGRGIAGESVMVTAQRLLRQFGSLKGIAGASLEELAQVKGIGLAKAAQISAAFELTSRLEGYSENGKKETVKTPEDVMALVRGRLKGKKKEYFLALRMRVSIFFGNDFETRGVICNRLSAMTKVCQVAFFFPHLLRTKTGLVRACGELQKRLQAMHIPGRSTAVSEIVRGVFRRGNHASKGRPHRPLTLHS